MLRRRRNLESNPPCQFSNFEHNNGNVNIKNEPSPSKETNENENAMNGINKRKRKSANSIIPKLIDNKRAHLEKKLSASQRDSIMLSEAKEDKSLRREIINSINNSNEIFSNAMTGITDSIKMLSKTMTTSMQVMSQCMNPSQPQIPAM